MSEAKSGLTLIGELGLALRNWIIPALLVLLLVFPEFVSKRLALAGFTEGSFAGLTWKVRYEQTRAAAETAGANIGDLEHRLRDIRDALEKQISSDRGATVDELDELTTELTTMLNEADNADKSVRDQLASQKSAREGDQVSERAREGWMYLGRASAVDGSWVEGDRKTVAHVPLPVEVGTELTIVDTVYLRGEPTGRWHSSGQVLGTISPGERVVVTSMIDASPARSGGVFLWAKVRQ